MAARKSPQTHYHRESPQPEGASRSHAMSQQLKNGTYECMICTEGIRTQVATWHCRECFQVFHLFCLKKWSKSEGSGIGNSFRCPNCQKHYDNAPNKYLCFCGKRIDPQPDGFLVPHTCGEVCGRRRAHGCPHSCTALCHPGPCADCTQESEPKSCPCGKSKYTHQCGKPEPKYTCNEICGRPLNCGTHTCPLPCHYGPCGACEIKLTVTCKCEKQSRELICGSPQFTCEAVCAKPQRCGVHHCNVVCHAGSCPPCDTDPEVVFTCPCGKTMLPEGCRTVCTDAIPTCGQVCGKVLGCGRHYCARLCHEGDCGACEARVTASCPCASTQRKLLCTEVDDFRCDRKCKAKLSCGRHDCSTICCPHRRSANPADHICNRPCGKQLSCGHRCPDPCHRGGCQPCINIVTTELSCACGLTVLEPPQPCGTAPPECPRPCEIPLPCGHTNMHHTCHFGPCPKCFEKVDRACLGGHTVIKNVLCSGGTLSCGAPCSKPLPCGHTCLRKCHGEDCVETDRGRPRKCEQPCGRLLPCGHACRAKCHPGNETCPACTTTVGVLCKCGETQTNLGCAAFLDLKSNTPPGVAIMTECTADCFSKQRLGFFAGRAASDGTALGRMAEEAPRDQKCYYSVNLWSIATETPDIVLEVERHLVSFVRSQEKMLMLPAMARNKRAVVHELGQYFCVKTEAVDREPNRTICLWRTPLTRMPFKLLSQARQDPDMNPSTMIGKVMGHGAHACILVFEARPEHITDSILFGILRFAAGKFVIVPPESFPNIFPDRQVPPRAQAHLGNDTVAYLAIFGRGSDAQEAFKTVRQQGCSVLFHKYGESPPPMNFADPHLAEPRYFFNEATTTTEALDTLKEKVTTSVPKPGSASWASAVRKDTARQKELARPVNVETANKFAALRR